MRTSFITRVMPENLLQKAINYRKGKMADKVVVTVDVNSAEKKILEANKVSLGRFINRKNASLTFAPVKDGLFKGQTEMIVSKYENIAVLGEQTFTYKKPYLALRHIVDFNSVSNPKDFLREIRKMINSHVTDEVKCHCEFDDVSMIRNLSLIKNL